MGRMGWQAPRRQRRLLCASGTVLPVRRPHTGRRARCGGAAAVLAGPAARGAAPVVACPAVGSAGGRVGRQYAVVRAAAAFLLWGCAPAAGAAARARAVSAPDELHFVRRRRVRDARLGGACRDAMVDLDVMERWVRSWVSQSAS